MNSRWNGIERRAPQPDGHPSAELLARRVLRASPAGIGLSIEGVIQMVNPAMSALTGYAADELIGQPTRKLYPDAEAFSRVARENDAQIALNGGGVVETRWCRKDGGIVHIQLFSVPIDASDLSRGISFTALDFTVRKNQERQQLDELEKQREVLVREVHHRIKNNLQSVAGLLRRELGKFMELDPHLDKAITQVHAIAVVHGLQSSDPDEAIRLCDTTEQICKVISEQTQQPVDFHIEKRNDAFQPVQINRDEAVAVALILNELILNAVKHSPAGAAAPRVNLRADGISAGIAIDNAMTTAPNFDLGSGNGLKTGLNLVRALLPERGARLDYARGVDNRISAHLRLSEPVVQAIVPRGT